MGNLWIRYSISYNNYSYGLRPYTSIMEVVWNKAATERAKRKLSRLFKILD